MDGWEVRHYRKTRVHFDGVAYHILRQEATRSGGVRYVLEPWPQELADAPAHEIHYDLAYVEARDAARRVLNRRSVGAESSCLFTRCWGCFRRAGRPPCSRGMAFTRAP